MAYIRYVNTASTSGGDGTTNNTTGATRAYESLESALSGEATTLTDDLIIRCCGSTADTITGVVEFAGSWTFGAYTVTVEGNEAESDGAHEGEWSTSHYRVEKSITSGYILRNNGKDSVTWKRFQARNSDTNGAEGAFVFRETNGATSIFDGMIIRVPDGGNGIYMEDANTDVTVRNSLFINDTGSNTQSEGIYSDGSSGTKVCLIQNCGIHNWNDGVENDGGTMTNTNNWIFDSDSADIDGTSTTTYCATDDTVSGTGNINPSPWTDEFTDYTNGDYTIKNTSADIYQAGTDLSGSFTTDILGDTRSEWSIGPFDAPAGAGPTSEVRKSLMLMGVGI